VDGPTEANGHEVEKPTPSFATPLIETLQQNAIFFTNGPRDAIGHDVATPTPTVTDDIRD
jgi:hypothetical protein